MLLLRHAQSTWNEVFGATRIDAGIVDPPLTRAGTSAAAVAAAELRGLGIRQIWTSPYRRTLETASILAEALGAGIEVEPLVRERCAFSCDQGTPASRLAREWPAVSFASLAERWWSPLIESAASLAERARRFHERVAGMADADQVLVVSHWGFIRCATGLEVGNLGAVRLDLGGARGSIPGAAGTGAPLFNAKVHR